MPLAVVCFYVVQRLFKEVEEELDDETKLDIGLWLVTFPPLGPKVRSWPKTFAKVLIACSAQSTYPFNASVDQL